MRRIVSIIRFDSRTLAFAAVLAGSPLGFLRAQGTPTNQATPPAANPSDVSSKEAIIAALYDVISGPAGQPRNWDRMRSLFIPGGRLIPATQQGPEGKVLARVLDVDAYIERARGTLEKNGFFEREISNKTETFGSVTHVFSTYESRRAKEDPKPFARGINSIQLLNDGARWWVVTVYWDSERPNNPIPAKYLP